MNVKIKNILGFLLGIFLIVAMFALIYYVNYYAAFVKSNLGQNFTVSADAKVYALTDVAQFNYSLVVQGQDIAAIQKNADSKISQANDFIKSQGVADDDIKTVSYSLEPQYQYYRCDTAGSICPPPKIVSYNLSETVQVKIRNFSIISQILQNLVNQGINQISGLNFTIDDPSKYQDQARDKAITLAQQRAKDIAQAAGFRLGRLISIEENSTQPPIYIRSLEVAPTPAALSNIQPGNQEIIVTVSLKYEIR